MYFPGPGPVQRRQVLWPQWPPGHTWGSVPESSSPWFPGPAGPGPTAKVPLSPDSGRLTSRPKAISTRRGISSHDHAEGKDPNSITWDGEEVQDLRAERDMLGSSVFPEILASRASLCCSLYLRHPSPPNSHHSFPLLFQVSVCFLQAALYDHTRLTQMSLLPLPQLPALPTPMLPLPLWEGRSHCWSGCLLLQAVSSLEPFVSFSGSLTQHLMNICCLKEKAKIIE